MTRSAVRIDPVAVDVAVTNDAILVSLADDRELSVPLEWSPKLLAASKPERANWQLLGRGERVRWPEIDEEIAIASLLRVE